MVAMSTQESEKDQDWFDKCTFVSECVDKYISEFDSVLEEFQHEGVDRGKVGLYRNPFKEYKEYIADQMDCKLDLNNLLKVTEEMLIPDSAELYVLYANDLQKRKIRTILSRYLSEVGTRLDDSCFGERLADFDERVSEFEMRQDAESDRPFVLKKMKIFGFVNRLFFRRKK